MLPELRSSVSIVPTKPLPTSQQQSGFLPEEIIFSLTQPQNSKQKLGPPSRGRNFNTTSVKGVGRPPPASVWNYKRRNRFKHLLDYAPCVCGAGKDISYLYDVPHSVPHLSKPEPLDQSHVRKEDETNIIKPLILPDSIIPEEYHIVKNKGVIGIQFHEDKYSTQPLDHEKHLALFPSMNPNSRCEVIQLRNTFENMMDKAGINDLETNTGVGPTQMHELLKLIKKEQDIYNIVFSELIRQTTVECAERGELLHLVWSKYHQLLNKVPEQIMSLHEDIIAQRALDIRLTDELMRFKGTIGTLTNELADVKEHDRKVTREAQKAQEDLKGALAESQKNASLIVEYHDLYELQRQRLERQVFILSEERDIWSTAAYSLAIKVTEEYKLTTAMRLQLLEKSWVKIASHFTILLSDRDTDLLTKIQGHLEKWRNQTEDIYISLKKREDNMRDSMKIIRADVESYLIIFKQKYIDHDNGVTKIPDENFTRLLIASVKFWLESVVKETDTFSGVMLLNSREAFSQLHKEMEEWTDSALKMFGRHCRGESKVHPYQTSMLILNKEINQLLIQLHDRITGENGVANIIIHFQNSLEIWEARLKSSAPGALVLQESEWGSFYHVLEQWLSQLNQAIGFTDTTLNNDKQDGQSHPSIQDVIRKTQMWAAKASNAIDSEDAKLVEQVSSLHSEMVRWMIQVLLRLAPNMEGYSQEAGNIALLGSASIQQLTEVANTLFESLETFSNYVTICCDGIVMEETLIKQDNHEENAGYEMNDLKRLRTAQMLMSQLTGMSMESLFPTETSAAFPINSVNSPEEITTFMETTTIQSAANEIVETEESNCNNSGESEAEQKMSEISTSKNVNEFTSEASLTTVTGLTKKEHPDILQPAAETKLDIPILSKSKIEQGKGIEVLGVDSNTHKKLIEGKHIQSLDRQPFMFGTDGASDTRKGFEALAAVETLQDQLMATEERAQLAEERASHAEAKIVSLEIRIRALEKQVEKHHEQVNLLPASTPAAAQSRSQSSVTAANKVPRTHSPMAGADVKEEKSGRKSGKSSSKFSKRS